MADSTPMAGPAQQSSVEPPPPSTPSNPRFTIELEFVSSLANPYYLSHLAVNYPNLLGISTTGDETSDEADASSPDAQAFANYLAYLYAYWKTPEYSQFLPYPGPTLRALRLLQEPSFRRDIIRPQVIEALAGTGAGMMAAQQQHTPTTGTAAGDGGATAAAAETEVAD